MRGDEGDGNRSMHRKLCVAHVYGVDGDRADVSELHVQDATAALTQAVLAIADETTPSADRAAAVVEAAVAAAAAAEAAAAP